MESKGLSLELQQIGDGVKGVGGSRKERQKFLVQAVIWMLKPSTLPQLARSNRNTMLRQKTLI